MKSKSFDEYYSQIYGDRWNALKKTLLEPSPKIAQSCFKGYPDYFLDAASIRVAQALQVQPEHQVVDLCAAPGGKTLILLMALSKISPENSDAASGFLTANELSQARKKRLETVIEQHVPPSLHSKIKITNYDGNQFGLKRADAFDRVLLDAPCSSERHLLEADPEMKEWKFSRTQQLSPRQYSLLCSAVLTAKKGAKIVYSTCSISPLENDEVIQRLLDRKGDHVQLDSTVDDLQDLEKTQCGFQVFPDRANGAGPIYLSRLVKL